jgi:hypothetical protein
MLRLDEDLLQRIDVEATQRVLSRNRLIELALTTALEHLPVSWAPGYEKTGKPPRETR